MTNSDTPQPLTWKALAEKLGVTVQSVSDWRKLRDAPRTTDLKVWLDFRSERLLGKEGQTKHLAELKAELMREQITLARARNKRESGEVIASAVVDELLGMLAQKLDLLLRMKLETELGPRVVGKNAAGANVEGSKILDEIREVVNGNLAKFRADATTQSRNNAYEPNGTEEG